MLAGQTVLVVDDNRDLRQLMEHLLRRAGYLVLHAINGMSAMRIVNDYPNDINFVVCDVILPDIHGADLLDSLQVLCPTLQGLLITGDRHAVAPDCLWPVLEKPFSMMTLLRHVAGEQPCIEDKSALRYPRRRAAPTQPTGEANPQSPNALR